MKKTIFVVLAMAIAALCYVGSSNKHPQKRGFSFEQIPLNEETYSQEDPLGVQAIHNLENDVTGLKQLWKRGDGSNSIVLVQLDYSPITGWTGTNEAFSAYSYAEGVGNVVGLKGYRYVD